MESTLFDSLTLSSADSSTPQTPSPRSSLSVDPPLVFPDNVKQPLDFEHLDSHSIFSDAYHQYPERMADEPITHSVDHHNIWNGNHHSSPFFAQQRGSLLHELYSGDDHLSDRPHDYLDHSSPPPLSSGSEWNTPSQLPHQPLPLVQMQHEPAMGRRATFPTVRSDREDGIHSMGLQSFVMDQHQQHHQHDLSQFARPDLYYTEPMPMVPDTGSPQPTLSAEPSALHGQLMHMNQPPHLEESYLCNMSPHPILREMDPNDNGIKIEDPAPVIVPSQGMFYTRPPSSAGLPPMPLYMAPHAAIPIQHTDDAASKETQYLRRRCFNCHTTEPPSWRRSTLNPGKIVCNKCGLYERTHLRPRPHRFDELRAGNKARKHAQSKVLGGSSSPKEKATSVVKKEQGEIEFEVHPRRGSVSGSSVHSGCSDYDDNVSVYSSTGSLSGAESYNNSPLISSFSIPRLSPSQSPQISTVESGGIRLPNAPLHDIASMQSAPNSPRKAATIPFVNANGRPISPAGSSSGDYFSRRGSMPVEHPHQDSPLLSGLPEMTSWQPVDMENKPARSRSSSLKP